MEVNIVNIHRFCIMTLLQGFRDSFIAMNHLFLRNIFLFSFHTKTPSKLTAAKAYTEYFSCMPTVEIARTHDVHKTRFQISIVNKNFIGLFVE